MLTKLTRQGSALLRSSSSRAQERGPSSVADPDDKGAKIERTQSERVRNLGIVILMLMAVGVVVGFQKDHFLKGNGNVAAATVVDAFPSEEELQQKVDELDQKVREYKALPHVVMEKDPEGLKLTKELQRLTYKLLAKRYGRHKFRVQVDLEFPESVTKLDGKPARDHFIIEMAPVDLIPCSVYNFLEIARTFRTGSFIRNAGHVLQAKPKSAVTKSMPFQEYSREFPHRKGTTGYAGRPSGPQWYISIKDNTINHGPGSQQDKNPYEADSLFGHVVEGMDDVVPRIHSTPQKSWLDKENEIKILKMTILVPKGRGEKLTWVPWTERK